MKVVKAESLPSQDYTFLWIFRNDDVLSLLAMPDGNSGVVWSLGVERGGRRFFGFAVSAFPLNAQNERDK